jgi:hypothetical protein
MVDHPATAETRDMFAMMTIDAETAGLVWWRKQRLLEMGFDHRQSYDIAKMVLNLHHLERLLERGCPPLTAVAILS